MHSTLSCDRSFQKVASVRRADTREARTVGNWWEQPAEQISREEQASRQAAAAGSSAIVVRKHRFSR